MRFLGQIGLLQLMTSCNVEQLWLSRDKFGKDLVMQFIAAWLKGTAAIKALAKFKSGRSDYVVTELTGTLHAVWRPLGLRVSVEVGAATGCQQRTGSDGPSTCQFPVEATSETAANVRANRAGSKTFAIEDQGIQRQVRQICRRPHQHHWS